MVDIIGRGKENVKESDFLAEIKYSGDYNLGTIDVINVNGESAPIHAMVQELNIFEDIEANAVTGNAVLVDNLNLINKIPLQGTERLAFKLATPGTSEKEHMVDATEESGYPFYIYALTDKKIVSETSVSYTIHFASRDFMRNTRIRVSQAYDGALHQSVISIFRDPLGLNSRKSLTYEETRNSDKVVIPNLRPFVAINLISGKAVSKNSEGAGYYFYETTKGFHFRSYESMLTLQGKFARNELITLRYTPTANVMHNKKVEDNIYSVQDYEFIQHYDTAAQQATGTYGSKVIMHNIYDKSYEIKLYDYHKEFSKHFQTDRVGRASTHNYPVSKTPVDDDELNVSEYTDSYICLKGTTRYLHNRNTGSFGSTVDDEGLTEATKISQYNQVHNSNILKITMSGHSYLQAGDVIYFEVPPVEVERRKGISMGYSFDEHHSGRYLVTKLRHRVAGGEYKMILVCIKDCVYTRHASKGAYTGKISPLGKLINLYDEDKKQSGEKASPGHPSNM